MTIAMEPQKQAAAGMSGASVNPNKALWEKGDFTRIAATMRQSGEALVGRVGIQKGMKLLDLGCGDGTTAIPPRDSAPMSWAWILPATWLKRETRRARELGLANLRFQEGDATNLSDLSDGSFDLVLTVFGAMFCAQAARRRAARWSVSRAAADVS
jgi:SAM-dependent methyltransferase